MEERAWQQRSPRPRWCDDRSLPRLVPTTLAEASTTTSGRHLSSGSGQTKSDSQTGWQSTAARHSKRARPFDPTSHPANPHPDLRPALQRIEFRVPTQTLGSQSHQADSTYDSRWLPSLRGHGLIKVLRPSSTRCLNGSGVSEGSRQAVAEADRTFSRFRRPRSSQPWTYFISI